MRHPKSNFRKVKKRTKQIVKGVRGYLNSLKMEDIFKNKNGRPLDYIKEIKEVDDLAIVRLRGSIDSYTIPVIRFNFGGEIKRYLDKHILLDFKEVVYIDSSTLASLIQLLDELKTRDRKLGIINITLLMKNYLTIARLESIVCVYKDEKAALKDLSQSQLFEAGILIQ